MRQVGEVADGAVVASALINFLDTVPDADQLVAAEQFVRGLRGEAPFPPQVSVQTAAGGTVKTDERHTQGDSVPQPETTGHRYVACRGIRGATTVETNTSEDILEETTNLLDAIIRLNDIAPEEVVSAIFTTTPEITASFPAMAARELGWTDVPLLAPMRWPFQDRYAASYASCSTSIPRARRLRFAMSTCVRREHCARSGRMTTHSWRRFSAA